MSDERGSAILLNMISVAIFATLAAVVFAGVRSQVKLGVYEMRQAQAATLAQAGLQDALHSLEQDTSWRAGFTKKTLGTGYYTVTLTAATPPTITSTGYSKSIFTFGPAVRTVSVNTVFTTSGTVTKGVTSNALTVSGTVNAYDSSITLTPSTANWTGGVILFSNGGVDTSGASCPPANINANVYYYSSPAPSASCVSGTITHSTYTLSLTSTSCGTCQTVNNNLTGISPAGAYQSSSGKLTVSAGQTVTLSSGTYFFHFITFQGNGILVADNSSGTIKVFYDTKIQETTTCQFVDTSSVPAKLLLADFNNSNKVDLSCPSALHAYLEGTTNQFEIHSGNTVYGHIVAQNVTIDSGGALHYDLGEGLSYSHVSWTTGVSGSWSESYKRQ